ncbi:MAG: phage tail protein [Caldilineaceae bacterium]|nr:phage tail protein [Caldilineaceae bacterium]
MAPNSGTAPVFSSFRFVVSVDGETLGAFTECTLPTVEVEIEEIKEGGLNVYTHQLPGRRKQSRLVLKRGVGKGALVQWFLEMMAEEIERKPIAVTLLDEKGQVAAVWRIEDAFPVKWVGPNLNSGDGAIAVQTLEFAGGEITVQAGG